MRNTRMTFRRGLLILSGMTVAACSDTTEPTMATVAGNYTATSFTSTSAGATTNELSDGATLVIALTAQGTTTGQLFIPDGDEGGGDLTANLVGTWSLSENTVTLEHGADTIIRDMEFTVSGNTLVADRTFGATRVQITLTRQ